MTQPLRGLRRTVLVSGVNSTLPGVQLAKSNRALISRVVYRFIMDLSFVFCR